MLITRLEVLDFKRIGVVAIDPNGNQVLLTGDNGQGKSSLLDAVMFALKRSGAEKPIRDGAEFAEIAMTIEGQAQFFTIRRKIKGTNAYLDVTTREGAKMPSPQKFLDALVGNLAFDPEAFTRLTDKQQAEALRIAVGLNTADLDACYKESYAQRTEANRAKEKAEALFKACPVVSGAPRERQSASALFTQRESLRAELNATDTAGDLLEETQRNIEILSKNIATMESDLETAREAMTKLLADEERQTEMFRLRLQNTDSHAINIAEIDATLQELDDTNAQVDAHNRTLEERATKQEAYRTALARAKQLDDECKRLLTEKDQRIAAANMPIPGLAITDDVVTLNGVPFADLNTAQRIQVSAMIAMAQNPTLKVIFVREGALISRTNLAVLQELADAQGYQLWIEKFQEEAGSTGLHIVEGHVEQIDGKPAPAAQLSLI